MIKPFILAIIPGLSLLAQVTNLPPKLEQAILDLNFKSSLNDISIHTVCQTIASTLKDAGVDVISAEQQNKSNTYQLVYNISIQTEDSGINILTVELLCNYPETYKNINNSITAISYIGQPVAQFNDIDIENNIKNAIADVNDCLYQLPNPPFSQARFEKAIQAGKGGNGFDYSATFSVKPLKLPHLNIAYKPQPPKIPVNLSNKYKDVALRLEITLGKDANIITVKAKSGPHELFPVAIANLQKWKFSWAESKTIPPKYTFFYDLKFE